MDINQLQGLIKSVEIDGKVASFEQLVEAAEAGGMAEIFVTFGDEGRYLWVVIDGHVSLGDTPLSCIDQDLLAVANAIADLFGL
jgi:hypothetical protein